MVFQGRPGGDDEPAPVAGEQHVALVRVPLLEHCGDVAIAEHVGITTEATRLMVHGTLET